MSEEKNDTLSQARRELAKASNRQAWELLEKHPRSEAEDETMLLAACTSLYHWKEVGTAVHSQRGSWLIAKVYLSLGQSESAVAWAQKCLQITENRAEEMEDFDQAYAQEILARCYAMSGDLSRAGKHRREAVRLGKMIQDREDREIFHQDLNSGNWYQLNTDQD